MTDSGAGADTIIDRIGRVKRTIAKEIDPRAVQVAVDGSCPNESCHAPLSMEVHSDSASLTCTACGGVFAV
jgi:hypothetical protein